MRQRLHATRPSNRRPTRLTWWIRTKNGLVIKQQFALTGMSELIEFANYPCGLADSFRRMLFLKTVAVALVAKLHLVQMPPCRFLTDGRQAFRLRQGP